MEEKLLQIIKDIQSDYKYRTLDEAATKQVLILPILICLGWNVFSIDEVHPEYTIGGKRVDYSLRYNGINKVFIEVKKISEDLERHKEQLLNYAFNSGVKLAVLTNGITWWFYLPLSEGTWEQRKFYSIEICDQKSDEITLRFIDFLSKENVITGKAILKAEDVYRGKQKEEIIKKNLPLAWNRILKEANEDLIEIIADTTEKLCGYKPDAEIIADFLTKKIIGENIDKQNGSDLLGGADPPTQVDVTNTSIRSFSFQGIRYEVRSWKDLLIKICEIIHQKNSDSFEEVLMLTGRKRPYFSKNPHPLRSPFKIPNTNIFVETNLSAVNIVKLLKEILSLFGCSEEDLSIEAVPNKHPFNYYSNSQDSH